MKRSSPKIAPQPSIQLRKAIAGNSIKKMSNRKPFEGKVVLVTGSGRGIGRKIAEEFADTGAKVVVTARTEHEVHEIAGTIRKNGGEALAFPLDLRDQQAVSAMVNSVIDQWHAIHVLVNNAAYFPQRIPFLEVPFEKWTEVIDINLFAVFRLTQLVAREMVRTQTPGRIVNISSINAIRYRVGTIGQTQYNVSKAALDNFTKGLAMELAPYGITVNGVAPGFVRTAASKDDPLDEAQFKKLYLEEGRIPLRRYGTPEDCAKLVLFLTSERCTWMTGETIHQDGGMNCIF